MKLQKIIFLLVLPFILVCPGYAALDLRNAFTKPHVPVIVMATDNNYVIPTAVSILSLKNTTPDSKKVIVFSNELSEANKTAMEKLQDGNTQIVVEEVPEEYLKAAAEYSTDWNILVQLRIFYQELFNKLNQNQKFLNKLGLEDGIHYFIHLDSDTLVIRNLFSIFEQIPTNVCFASTNLHFLSLVRLVKDIEHEKKKKKLVPITGLSGGVVFWNLDEINNEGKSLASIARELKKEEKYKSFYNNDKCYQMWNILCGKNRGPIVEILNKLKTHSIEDMNEYAQLFDCTMKNDESFKKDLSCFMDNFLFLAAQFEDVISDKIEKIFEFLISESSPEIATYSAAIYQKGKAVKEENPTEEAVLGTFSYSILEEKYNFILKYVFPEIDCMPEEDIKEPMSCLSYKNVNCFSDVVRELLERHRDLMPIINYNFQNMVVMHFDVCYKPWSAEFDKIAGSISGLKIITNIYASYVNQLNGFEQIDDWKKQFELKVGYPMGPLRAGMIQDRLKGISRQEYY